MSWMLIFLPSFLGAVDSCQDVIPNAVEDLTVSLGGNVTLYCDCKLHTLNNIVWYRNCSHENQPTLILNWKERDQGTFGYGATGANFTHLNMMWNKSTKSYDLLIRNIRTSHLGLYYCGTEILEGTQGKGNKTLYKYTYGNFITRISFASGIAEDSKHCARGPAAGCGQCWRLLSILCPTCALLLSLISSLVVYLCCRRTGEDLKDALRKPDGRDGTSACDQNDDGLCYATMDMPLRSQRPKKKRPESSDLCTYSAVNAKRV